MSRAAVTGLAVSAAGIVALVIAGPGTRLEWWDFRTGFRILLWAACLGLAGVAISAAGCVIARPRRRRGLAVGAAGILLGIVALGVPADWYATARSLPKIHDISTDTVDPPKFVAILPLRANAPDSAEYGGPGVAAAQAAAYPDVRPLEAAVPPKEAYARALRLAKARGWKIVAEDPAEGRIEATATTRWFGFKDDIVLRILPASGGASRIDMRSESRVGISDVGTNARRIHTFLAKLSLELTEPAGSPR